jgi:hypothetical protein
MRKMGIGVMEYLGIGLSQSGKAAATESRNVSRKDAKARRKKLSFRPQGEILLSSLTFVRDRT